MFCGAEINSRGKECDSSSDLEAEDDDEENILGNIYGVEHKIVVHDISINSELIGNSSAVAANKVCNSPRLEELENAKRDVPSSSESAGSKAVERPNKRKGLLIKEKGICSSEKKPVNLALTKFNKSKPAINKSKPAIKKSKPAMKKSKPAIKKSK